MPLLRATTLAGLVAALLALAGCDPGAETMPTHHDGGSTRDAGSGDAGVVRPDTSVDRSVDSDGDHIADADEGNGAVDTDRDGTPDTMDADSDGDGITDANEAGDADPLTPPIDTDGDGLPDFRDLDSDGDGLSDMAEVAAHTSPTNPDSDGDGIGDLVEVTAHTDPNDPTSNPHASGDFFFLEPFMAAPSPTRDTLVFATHIQRADVFFMIDTSISMQSYIDTIRASLTSTIIPGVAAAIHDVHFGVGQFDICPPAAATHMPGTCRGIEVDQISTGDTTAVGTALMSLTADCSGVHEPYAQSIILWASGADARWPSVIAPTCASGVGLGCMRRDALPILLMIGDEAFTESYNTAGTACSTGGCTTCATYPTVMQIITAVNGIAGRVMQLGPASMHSPTEWGMIATGTGAVDATGMPLIFPMAGSSTVDAAVVTAISTLATSTPLDITAQARDDTTDAIDALAFISRLETNTTGGIADPRDMTQVCVGGLPVADLHPVDAVFDTFPNVRPGTPVCFDIIPAMNTTVMPGPDPILVRAYIDVLGDGITVLDTREVFFLIPPEIRGPS